MAKNSKVKKRKLAKQQPQNIKIEKKLKKKKKIGKPEATPNKKIQNQVESDTDSADETEPEKFQKLLEPYTKEQLINFIVDAAVKDAALYGRIVDAADRDVSHRKIFVHGLGWDTSDETLAAAFEPYGEIEDCKVVKDRVTGKAKGYGFVLFKSRKGASKALKEPRKKISNRMTSCQLASVGPVPPPQSQDTIGRKIYVSNVQADVDPEKLRAFFAKFGEIETGPIGFDMQTGKSRGFALFVYKTQEAARKALQEPYKVFEGHQLHCQKAADGKNKVTGGAASITTAVQPVQAPVLAAMAASQNLALLGQHPGLSPLYSGLLTNPNAAALFAGGSLNPLAAAAGGWGQGVIGASQVGQMSGAAGSVGSVAMGLGAYGAPGSHGLGSLGGSQSVLGAYGSGASSLQGLQHAYPSTQIGQRPSAKAPATGGSYSGHQSYV